MSNKHIEIGIYISATLLAVGVFLPLTSLPVIGDVSYNRVAEVESYIVVAAALSATVLIFTGMQKFTFVSAAVVWLTLLFPAIKSLFKSDDGGFLSKTLDKAQGVMQDFAADLFLNVAEFSWGGFIFLIGLLAFTVTCILRSFK